MLRCLCLLVPAILFLPGAAAQQKKPVTLETAATSAAGIQPDEIVWSPDGSRFIWQQGAAIRMYDIPSRVEKDLVSTAGLESKARTPRAKPAFEWTNRRVRQQRLQWLPQGAGLLLLAGGDLFVYRFDRGWQQLTETADEESDPKLSPNGEFVSFLRGVELYTIELATGRERRLSRDGSPTRWNGRLDWVYPEELDLATAHWWSPDSRSIAYLQFDLSQEMVYPHGDLLPLRPVAEPQRYPQAGTPNPTVRLGVVAARGGKTRWLQTASGADALLARVAWLPSSSEIAVQRLNRIQNSLQVLATTTRGKTRTLLAESDKAWINVTDDWRFLPRSGALLWSSERSGYRHLYLYPAQGQSPLALTSGSWEVSEVACVDEAGGRIFFLSTEATPLERHLYSVSWKGGERRRLTPEPGWHQVSMAPGCGHFLDTWSSLNDPPRKLLRNHTGVEVGVFRQPDNSVLKEYELFAVETVSFTGRDGARFHGRLTRPAQFDPSRRYPAIVMVYGGPGAQAVVNRWRGADWEQALAHKGFVVWQMDNRGSAGRGHAWEAKLARRLGKQELADQLEGLDHLLAMGFVDSSRIGIHGWSYGGYMTLYSLLNAPERFRAGVAGAPVTDWQNYDTIYTERYLGLPAENEAGYRESSVTGKAGQLQAALMLVHNFQDDNVLFQHTLKMIAALQTAGKPFELMLYPQKTHGVTGPARRHMLEAITAFFERHLMSR